MFRLENVSKLYQHDGKTVTALGPTNLDIQAGEFIAVVGPSGSGKSTLLTLLGGMLAPTAGKIWFDGQSLYDLTVAQRAEMRRLKMGFVFQSFNLVPYLSARQNVQVPLLLRGDSRRAQQTRSLELLALVGLADRANHKPCQLSVGQQQRVALARTLANDPQLILADEPTGNLDPATRANVLAFFDDFHRAGKTIVMVTHDSQAAQHATRSLHMANGSFGNPVGEELCRSA